MTQIIHIPQIQNKPNITCPTQIPLHFKNGSHKALPPKFKSTHRYGESHSIFSVVDPFQAHISKKAVEESIHLSQLTEESQMLRYPRVFDPISSVPTDCIFDRAHSNSFRGRCDYEKNKEKYQKLANEMIKADFNTRQLETVSELHTQRLRRKQEQARIMESPTDSIPIGIFYKDVLEKEKILLTITPEPEVIVKVDKYASINQKSPKESIKDEGFVSRASAVNVPTIERNSICSRNDTITPIDVYAKQDSLSSIDSSSIELNLNNESILKEDSIIKTSHSNVSISKSIDSESTKSTIHTTDINSEITIPILPTLLMSHSQLLDTELPVVVVRKSNAVFFDDKEEFVDEILIKKVAVANVIKAPSAALLKRQQLKEKRDREEAEENNRLELEESGYKSPVKPIIPQKKIDVSIPTNILPIERTVSPKSFNKNEETKKQIIPLVEILTPIKQSGSPKLQRIVSETSEKSTSPFKTFNKPESIISNRRDSSNTSPISIDSPVFISSSPILTINIEDIITVIPRKSLIEDTQQEFVPYDKIPVPQLKPTSSAIIEDDLLSLSSVKHKTSLFGKIKVGLKLKTKKDPSEVSQESLQSHLNSSNESLVHVDKPVKRGLLPVFKKMASNTSLVQEKRGASMFMNAMDALNLKKKENRMSVISSIEPIVVEKKTKRLGNLFKKKVSVIDELTIQVQTVAPVTLPQTAILPEWKH